MNNYLRLLLLNALGLVLVPSVLLGALSTKRNMPELYGVKKWLNVEKVTPSREVLQGRVTLVYFWNASCASCRRQLPYLSFWASKYRSEGLVVLGVHSPVYEFEKNLSLLQTINSEEFIQFPMGHDPELITYNAFGAPKRPTTFLIDDRGRIRHTFTEENQYDSQELIFQDILKESKKAANLDIDNTPPLVDLSQVITPDVFFGYDNLSQFGNRQRPYAGATRTYKLPLTENANNFYLEGDWEFNNQFVTLMKAPGKIKIRFRGNGLSFIAGTNNRSSVSVKVLINDLPLDVPYRSRDMLSKQPEDSQILIGSYRLYDVANFEKDYSEKQLTLIIETEGLDFYGINFTPIRLNRELTLEEEIEREIDEVVAVEEVEFKTTIGES